MMDVQRNLEHFNRDLDYFANRHEELLRQYPERWVAIYRGQVVDTADDINRLTRRLREKGLDPGHVFCEYLTQHHRELILAAVPPR